MPGMTTLTAVADANKAAQKGSGHDAVLLVGEHPRRAAVPAFGAAACRRI